MRTLLLIGFCVALTVPVHAQSQDGAFEDVTRQMDHLPEVVQDEAKALANERQYLDEDLAPAYPTALDAGNIQLLIEETHFILYLQPIGQHTEVRLESRQLNVSTRVIEEANAFLRDLEDRLTASQG